MKLIITATGPALDDAVDPRFGRARYFVLVDDATGETTAHSNEVNLQAAQGAGIQAAQTVAGLGAEAVLTGHIGPKAFRVLQAAGIRIHTGASGTVRQALAAYRGGSLREASAADVEGHW